MMKGEARLGESRIKLGDFTACVTMQGGRLSVVWTDEDGRPVDLVSPTSTRRAGPRSITGEVRRLAGASRESIEGLYLRRRPIPYGQWRERYLDHPLTGPVAGKLIWTFGGTAISEEAAEQGTSAIYGDGRLIGIDGRAIDDPDPGDPVRLWHPINASVRDVLSWRGFLEALGITQPFKQTYREIYVLTDAERATNVYSNRFAAHFLDQRQFVAISKTRRWTRHVAGIEGYFAGITKYLRDWRLQAEYVVESAQNSGVKDAAQYVGTGHTRFFRPGRSSTPLETIPPVVFSEVMRDIDLFVGLASIGNDPTWIDNHRDGVASAYWGNVAFGELGAMASTRKAVLAGLLPKLKIADRCRIEGKYLCVRGKLMSYQIHLGSTNVRTAPGGQFLCIVPGQMDGVGKLFLPFEGDPTLSAILSKAFMLAEDDKIRDDVILNQFLRGI